jgi:predicted MFS family arabinose efflux permease
MHQKTIDRGATEKQTLWSVEYIFLLAINILYALSFYMIMPIIPKYASQLGASLLMAGILAGIFSITALVARPLGGFLADQFNKRWILVGSVMLFSFSAFGCSLSSTIPVLFGFRILNGIAFSISGTSVVALAASIIPKERLGEGIGYFGMGQIISTALGPNIGIWVGQHYSYPHSFGVSGAILLIIALLLIVFPISYRASNSTVPNRASKKLHFSDLIAPNLLPLALLVTVFSMTNGLVSSFLVLVGDERHIDNIGLYFTILAVCLLFVRPIAGRLSDKKGLAIILVPALALTAGESLLLAKASTLTVVLLAAVCKAFGQGSAQPSLQAACIKKLGPERSGVATSTYFIGADIGQGFGPILGGSVAQNYGYTTMFYCSAAILCSILLITAVSMRFNRNILESKNAI